eukprot:07555_1
MEVVGENACGRVLMSGCRTMAKWECTSSRHAQSQACPRQRSSGARTCSCSTRPYGTNWCRAALRIWRAMFLLLVSLVKSCCCRCGEQLHTRAIVSWHQTQVTPCPSARRLTEALQCITDTARGPALV